MTKFMNRPAVKLVTVVATNVAVVVVADIIARKVIEKLDK